MDYSNHDLILRHVDWAEMLKMQNAFSPPPKGIPEYYSISPDGECIIYPNPWIYEGLK